MLYEGSRNDAGRPAQTRVLILILMEYALWAESHIQQKVCKEGLNPYSNGICSMSYSGVFDMGNMLQS